MIMRRMMMMMMNLVSLGFPLYLSAFSLGTQFSQNTLMVHTKHIVLDTYQSHYHFLSHVKWNSTQSLKKVQNSDSQALDAEKKERRGWRQLGEIKSAGGYRPSHDTQCAAQSWNKIPAKVSTKSVTKKWLEGVSRSAVQIWNTKEFGKWERVMLGENVYFEWVMQYLHFNPGPHQEIHHISVIAHFCVPP